MCTCSCMLANCLCGVGILDPSIPDSDAGMKLALIGMFVKI